MKAMILTAGSGRRMRPLTDRTHKTLLPVGDQTILSRITDGLQQNGVRDIVVVTGYRRDELVEYLTAHYPDLNFTFVHNERYAETNNIYSMAMAFDAIDIDDDILLIESDLIYEPAIIERILASRLPNVALVDRYRSGMDGTVVSLAGDVISSIWPPHLQDSGFDFSDKYKTLNIYKFSREFCNTTFRQLLTYYAKTIDDNCYYELILGILIYMQRETVHAEVLDGEKWAEVDDPNDLRVAEFEFNHGKRREILEETFGGYWNHDILDFCFIRNMYFPNGSMLSELRNNLPALLQSYGSRQEVLNRKLAYHLLCREDRVEVLNGASQIYPLLRRYYSGRRALLPAPSFGEYPRTFTTHDLYHDEVGLRRDEIASKAQDAEIVVIVNPNNPTGSVVASDWVHGFAAEHPEKTVILDESFIDFSGHEPMFLRLEREPLDNLIVVKSLSKSLGVPGIRLGYVYSSNREFHDWVRGEIPIWNLNSMAEYLLEIILKHREALARSFEDTIRDREAFAGALADLDCVERVYPSGGNFLLVGVKEGVNAAAIAGRLLSEDSIFVKDVSKRFSSGGAWLRLAVRLPSENGRLVECLSEACLAIRR